MGEQEYCNIVFIVLINAGTQDIRDIKIKLIENFK